MVIMGVIGMLGLGTGKKVSQPMVLSADWKTIVSMTAVAFWLFIGAEYVIPISKDVKNARRNVPLGMFLGLGLICVVQSILVFGFHNYTPWDKLADSAAPHLLYGENLLGNVGKIWMAFVAALALISSLELCDQRLASICQGMAKMNMMPRCFKKLNKNNVPFVGVWFISILILVFAFISSDSSDAIPFLFWLDRYSGWCLIFFAHIDVLVLRHRLPKAPRSFKVPFGPVLPLVGIAGTVFMICNISTDPTERNAILLLSGAVFLALGVYSFFWIRFKMKMPVFKRDRYV